MGWKVPSRVRARRGVTDVPGVALLELILVIALIAILTFIVVKVIYALFFSVDVSVDDEAFATFKELHRNIQALIDNPEGTVELRYLFKHYLTKEGEYRRGSYKGTILLFSSDGQLADPIPPAWLAQGIINHPPPAELLPPSFKAEEFFRKECGGKACICFSSHPLLKVYPTLEEKQKLVAGITTCLPFTCQNGMTIRFETTSRPERPSFKKGLDLLIKKKFFPGGLILLNIDFVDGQ